MTLAHTMKTAHPALPVNLLPKRARLEQTLYSLPDHWLVREGVQVGHFSQATVLISQHGVFALLPQEPSGVILHNPRTLIVADQNLMPQVQASQQNVEYFSRQMGTPVHPVMLFQQLLEPEELKARSLYSSTVREWEIDSVKIVTWESLKTYLLSHTRKKLSWEDTMRLSQKLRTLY
ncbi:hypothetical protein [Deinococcus cellulosilyticus]|uniref:Uncharacterized protein n=1 Tax=Deinococcus cellulosilyticus (strain DSM 18568 / NBRC 106333 / KACC 11606 / 5516J-15) TaxID=1223518 RepID=A0A511MY63_DEIC1|nr:hypothetical protein [Deinococcus cellulosilyticus]GEM45076.1 hypothetical protein DC3_07110 [Deinococcus cellulosilyticus NBRC 106333 = KACC 11606]